MQEVSFRKLGRFTPTFRRINLLIGGLDLMDRYNKYLVTDFVRNSVSAVYIQTRIDLQSKTIKIRV